MFLGYRLRKLRKENNMSQASLGKMIGVSKVSISGYEKGIRNPSIDIFRKILDVFNISADFMMGRELNAVCEDDESLSVLLSSDDIKVLKKLKIDVTMEDVQSTKLLN